jgi:GSH-dependent disulfide-bond oxidoreductase
MIDLYTMGTPNGQKASIMLEELGLPYRVHLVSFSAGETKSPGYLRINPNGKISAIVDHDGPGGKVLQVFESGAILMYLAEKTASPLLPQDVPQRLATLQWLMWQMSGVGPMFGQAGYFSKFAKIKTPLAIDRYVAEGHRLLAVLDDQLALNEYMAGATYTIADVATWPWIAGAEFIGLSLAPYANVTRWFELVGSRPAVQRGNSVGASS